ncbi:hypothetical protein A2U01_0067280, partial [Trifolium medium]|nr:hypothetical protein [Trifolium medium]
VEGEAMAILEAMREATSRGWSNIVFETPKLWLMQYKLIIMVYQS